MHMINLSCIFNRLWRYLNDIPCFLLYFELFASVRPKNPWLQECTKRTFTLTCLCQLIVHIPDPTWVDWSQAPTGLADPGQGVYKAAWDRPLRMRTLLPVSGVGQVYHHSLPSICRRLYSSRATLQPRGLQPPGVLLLYHQEGTSTTNITQRATLQYSW